MWKKTAATCLIAGIVALGTPTAASAQIDDDLGRYVDSVSVTVEPVAVATCQASTVAFGAGSWSPNETVTISVKGYRADAASIPESATADADGALVIRFTPPADGRADYEILFASATRTHTSVIAVIEGAEAAAVCDENPATALAALSSDGDDAALAVTGSDPASWLVVGGAGMLLAGGVLLAVRSVQRRRS